MSKYNEIPFVENELESQTISLWGQKLLRSLLEAKANVPPSCLRGDLVKTPQVSEVYYHNTSRDILLLLVTIIIFIVNL